MARPRFLKDNGNVIAVDPAAVWALRNAGWSLNAIAKKLRCSYSRVWCILNPPFNPSKAKHHAR